MDDVNNIIKIILDKNIDKNKRINAAINLSYYEEPRVLQVLRKVAADFEEDLLVSSTCGTSIGEILIKQPTLNGDFLKLIRPGAYSKAYAIIKNYRPEWIEELCHKGCV